VEDRKGVQLRFAIKATEVLMELPEFALFIALFLFETALLFFKKLLFLKFFILLPTNYY
jgi:hypothetical protein